MRKYSIIIPVYNRPDELTELLECLVQQTFKNFEVIIIEDGSKIKCEKVVQSFKDRLEIYYFYKENGGQGFARNYGFERAKGDYFILFDSDALIEANYLEIVQNRLNTQFVDVYGGPDTDHPSFAPIQKAISYSMTSVFTTGGIRGKKSNLGGTFHPRSFNMGLSRKVWEQTADFKSVVWVKTSFLVLQLCVSVLNQLCYPKLLFIISVVQILVLFFDNFVSLVELV
jgi:glycosyltransferase involved in cell wall biosynthesis